MARGVAAVSWRHDLDPIQRLSAKVTEVACRGERLDVLCWLEGAR